jgi:hypothetical protein
MSAHAISDHVIRTARAALSTAARNAHGLKSAAYSALLASLLYEELKQELRCIRAEEVHKQNILAKAIDCCRQAAGSSVGDAVNVLRAQSSATHCACLQGPSSRARGLRSLATISGIDPRDAERTARPVRVARAPKLKRSTRGGDYSKSEKQPQAKQITPHSLQGMRYSLCVFARAFIARKRPEIPRRRAMASAV